MIVEDRSTFHVTWQCHNKTWLLKERWAKDFFYDLLLKYKKKYGIRFHSYCLMDNHPHLTGTMGNKEQFSAFFRVVNSLFAKKINRMKKRRGQVVMDRFKSPRIQTDRDLLNVMAYIDLNPVRARKVRHPKENSYSSYDYYAYGKADPLIDPPDSYLILGDTPETRQKEYRNLVEFILMTDGHKKQNYSDVKFIGNPDWVAQKYRELTQVMKEKRKALHSPDSLPSPAST